MLNATGPQTLRFLPPLIAERAHVDDAARAPRAAASRATRVAFAAADERPAAHPATEVHRIADPPATRVASYARRPSEVGRVLLLYSGGLDTSVMLKWIQDEYEAEVVALTVNLGQPGEDYEVVKGKALQLGALDCHVVDAREEFARDLRAAGDQGQRRSTATATRSSPRSAAR